MDAPGSNSSRGRRYQVFKQVLKPVFKFAERSRMNRSLARFSDFIRLSSNISFARAEIASCHDRLSLEAKLKAVVVARMLQILLRITAGSSISEWVFRRTPRIAMHGRSGVSMVCVKILSLNTVKTQSP